MKDTRFIDRFEENVRLYPDKIILRDENTCITFRELDDLSGRVYAYLKKNGIGREDFVMISLPQGVLPYIAMVGVWKAGAAFVASSEIFSIEREDFIFQDCNCVKKIDAKCWTNVQEMKSIKGHEETGLHDVCYALYTSGSEGKPKGVIHEYGKLEYSAKITPEGREIKFPDNSIEYIPIPACFAGAVFACIWLMWRGIGIDTGPMNLMQNPQKLKAYFNDHQINIATLPPSFFVKHKIDTPYLKFIQLATETANNAYSDKYMIVNSYAQSEGCIICMFIIDKKYENTPIGKPLNPSDIVLLDDDGTIVPQGAIGELCYKNPYFRGYINDLEMTESVNINGYHRSGDIAIINEDGNYVILGRKTDMIKINGNRIEPAEIETAVKRVLNIDWAFAKGFVQEKRSFICVYYTENIEIDYTEVRTELMKILPKYMIPSYFVHIDEIPHLPNGKIDRQAFLAPDIEQYRAEYVAPTNELEERLCHAMEDVLELDRVGINDDFYLLGGDSLRTIHLLSECNIKNLQAADVYQSRTPRKIAETWMIKMIDL